MMASLKLAAIEKQISECHSELRFLGSEGGMQRGTGDLIISTGDISDVDGMFALVEYAKTGADVLFVMNYPGYLNTEECSNFSEVGPGLGFQYGAKDFFVDSGVKGAVKYGNVVWGMLKDKYFRSGFVDGFKRAFTDLAFNMVVSVWKEAVVDPSIVKGAIFFCIGGINSINPFSADSCKNELFVYNKLMQNVMTLTGMDEGSVFGSSGLEIEGGIESLFTSSNRLFLDFNGSAAFYNERWRVALSRVCGNVKGLFVMGGVHSYEKSLTMPRVENSLNRLSCATMNQLYHPERTSSLFTSMYNMGVPVFVVSNNSVIPYETYADAEKQVKTDLGWQSFLILNNISIGSVTGTSYLWRLANMYYNSGNNPPRKPFDYYTAVALSTYMLNKCDCGHLIGESRIMFYDEVYGITMLSKLSNQMSWNYVCSEYMCLADKSNNTRVEGLKVEDPLIRAAVCQYIPVVLARFEGGTHGDYRLRILGCQHK